MKTDPIKFANEVKEIVTNIPFGKVLTYGDIAVLAGSPTHARLVGKVLGHIGMGSCIPCHRVVNSQGRTAPHWHSQSSLLRAEGVLFKSNGCVDLKKNRWIYEDEDNDFIMR